MLELVMLGGAGANVTFDDILPQVAENMWRLTDAG